MKFPPQPNYLLVWSQRDLEGTSVTREPLLGETHAEETSARFHRLVQHIRKDTPPRDRSAIINYQSI